MKRVMLMLAGVMLIAVWTGVAFADSRFVFSDKTVKDKRTGLVWTRDANLGQWDWNGAFELVKELNRKKYAGFKDWRLPSKEELETLATYAAKGLGYNGNSDTRRPYQLFNQMGFYDVQANYYWSSTTYAYDANGAWVVDVYFGGVYYFHKAFSYCVLPVRGGQ